MPNANRLTITILAAVAEQEALWCSQRTKAGLQAAKRRGTKLGNPRLAQARKLAVQATRRKATEFADNLAPVLKEIEAAGVVTLRGVAQCLNARGFKTALGRAWTRQAVARIQRRLA
jgi:DNA invertase Pin-like site-specific DNA recombinase